MSKWRNLPAGLFTAQDRQILEQHGDRLAALANKSVKPTTRKEQAFVEEISGWSVHEPSGVSSILWLRYRAYIEMNDRYQAAVKDKEDVKRALSIRIKHLEDEKTQREAPLRKEIEQLTGFLKNCQSALHKYESPEQRGRRQCQCNGMNASCNYCQGSGWVE